MIGFVFFQARGFKKTFVCFLDFFSSKQEDNKKQDYTLKKKTLLLLLLLMLGAIIQCYHDKILLLKKILHKIKK